MVTVMSELRGTTSASKPEMNQAYNVCESPDENDTCTVCPGITLEGNVSVGNILTGGSELEDGQDTMKSFMMVYS